MVTTTGASSYGHGPHCQHNPWNQTSGVFVRACVHACLCVCACTEPISGQESSESPGGQHEGLLL